mmetsp:Transcript_88869/g.251945  ORF Transcript_88869/g.251945 Transcript_88869/m.251945 type:complete len:202 (-) Transcript_88869:323-928(-)
MASLAVTIFRGLALLGLLGPARAAAAAELPHGGCRLGGGAAASTAVLLAALGAQLAGPMPVLVVSHDGRQGLHPVVLAPAGPAPKGLGGLRHEGGARPGRRPGDVHRGLRTVPPSTPKILVGVTLDLALARHLPATAVDERRELCLVLHTQLPRRLPRPRLRIRNRAGDWLGGRGGEGEQRFDGVLRRQRLGVERPHEGGV